MPALPKDGILEVLLYGSPAVSKAWSTDHSLLVTYDNELLLIEAEKAIETIENRQWRWTQQDLSLGV